MRNLVLRGVTADYRSGTRVGPVRFGRCLRNGLRQLLDEQELKSLAMVYRRPAGQQSTAQLLNHLAVPVGDRCGGREYVPQLIHASFAFRSGRLPPLQARGPRAAFGPDLEVACEKASSTLCDSIGFDLRLEQGATAVWAWVAGQSTRLTSPGPIAGGASAEGRDWSGYLRNVGLEKKGSPLFLPRGSRAEGLWAGQPPVYVPVWLTIAYPDKRRETAVFPRIFLRPSLALAPDRHYVNGLHEVALRLPPGWRWAEDRLVPKLLMPREILSIGTFRMPVGGGGNCNREPIAAIRRMERGDALISIQEYPVTAKMGSHLTRNFPPMPARVELGRLERSAAGAAVEVPTSIATIPFSEHGRAFDALVYFRGRPNPQLRQTVASILGSLRLERRG
jgi:hypothetical protein